MEEIRINNPSIKKWDIIRNAFRDKYKEEFYHSRKPPKIIEDPISLGGDLQKDMPIFYWYFFIDSNLNLEANLQISNGAKYDKIELKTKILRIREFFETTYFLLDWNVEVRPFFLNNMECRRGFLTSGLIIKKTINKGKDPEIQIITKNDESQLTGELVSDIKDFLSPKHGRPPNAPVYDFWGGCEMTISSAFDIMLDSTLMGFQVKLKYPKIQDKPHYSILERPSAVVINGVDESSTIKLIELMPLKGSQAKQPAYYPKGVSEVCNRDKNANQRIYPGFNIVSKSNNIYCVKDPEYSTIEMALLDCKNHSLKVELNIPYPTFRYDMLSTIYLVDDSNVNFDRSKNTKKVVCTCT